MDPADDVADFLRLALVAAGGAQRVVEHDDPLGAADLFDQVLAFRVVDAPDLVVVMKSATRLWCGTKRKPSRSNSKRSASGLPLWSARGA